MDGYQERITEIEIKLEQLKQEKKQQQISVKEEKKVNARIGRNPTDDSERSVPIEKFRDTFEKVNFEWKNSSKKAAEFKYKEFDEEDTEAYVYLLDNVTPTIAVHPSLIEQTNKLVELVDVTSKPLKSTALRRFPRKTENGSLKSNYGYRYTFQTKGELESLLFIVEVLQSGKCVIEEY